MDKDDKFIVLASDGVWEFLTNEEIAGMVKPFFETKSEACAYVSVIATNICSSVGPIER